MQILASVTVDDDVSLANELNVSINFGGMVNAEFSLRIKRQQSDSRKFNTENKQQSVDKGTEM